MKNSLRLPGFIILGALGLLAAPAQAESVQGWLNWRGPQQNGTTLETNLPEKIIAKDALWTADFPGQSTPVIANGKLYIMGYQGSGPDLQEGVTCFDAATGKKLWQHLYNDFLSDIIYNRYASSSPTIDIETGNVYIQGTQGILAAFTPDGKELWKHSLMEEIGWLTFPNGRTASPVVDGDLVIVRGITANWGAQGPPSDRFYAFNKTTGVPIWASSPCERPKDNSFSYPFLDWLDNRRVLYATAGDGSVICLNTRNGEPLWRVPLAKAGINSTVLVHKGERVIAVYGTPYEPGQMVSLTRPNLPHIMLGAGPEVLKRKQVEEWSADLSTSTSSPILADNTIFIVTEKGDLCAVEADTGKIRWKLKLGVEQRNSSPLYGENKLYVPILDDPETKTTTGESGTTGGFYVINVSGVNDYINVAKPEILSHTALDGRCFGSPVVYNGKVYIQTTRKLYCFGKKADSPWLPPIPSSSQQMTPGPAVSLGVVPSEVTLRPGQSANFHIWTLDPDGWPLLDVTARGPVWTNFIPPTAKVRSLMKAAFAGASELVASNAPVPSAGAFEVNYLGLKGYIRGRVLPYPPLHQDFESFNLTETNATDGGLFAYPPLPWIGARFKFEVREQDGSKVLAKTVDNPLLQRAYVFLGVPDAKNYTIEAEVMSDGNKRKMSEVGVINQRYLIELKGNEQKLEVSSNLERFRASVDFKWQPQVWYHLKARVDVAADGSGVVRAKVWKRDDKEPAKWNLEVPHKTAHQNGSPGLFGFSPQAERVYIDNVNVTAN